MFNKISPMLGKLAERWADEKEHEDIAAYAAVLQKSLPKRFVISKMTKRPFGFKFNIGTDAFYSVTAKSGFHEWKRIS